LPDVMPSPVRIAASRAAHALRTAINVDRVSVVAAVGPTTAVTLARNHLAVTARLRIPPTAALARTAVLEGFVLRLLRQHLILPVERATDLAAHDAADHGTGHRCQHSAGALTNLIAENAACN